MLCPVCAHLLGDDHDCPAMPINLKTLQIEAHRIAVERKQWHQTTSLPAIVKALNHLQNEASEALCAWREWYNNDAPDTGHIAEELADVVICAASVAHELGIDLSSAVKRKMAYNQARAKQGR